MAKSRERPRKAELRRATRRAPIQTEPGTPAERAPVAIADALTARFDALLDRMQQPGARDAMQAAFDAPPEEQGKAAVAAARRQAGSARPSSRR